MDILNDVCMNLFSLQLYKAWVFSKNVCFRSASKPTTRKQRWVNFWMKNSKMFAKRRVCRFGALSSLRWRKYPRPIMGFFTAAIRTFWWRPLKRDVRRQNLRIYIKELFSRNWEKNTFLAWWRELGRWAWWCCDLGHSLGRLVRWWTGSISRNSACWVTEVYGIFC